MIVFVLLFLVTLSGLQASESSSPLPSPKYVLVEEHHHVVSHLVEFSRSGVLRSHEDPKAVLGETNPNGALLIHIDSHADMGLTPGLNQLPAPRLRTRLPSTMSGDFALIEHSVINDFLLLLGYMGIVEHIVFVEPPWSVLLRDAHYTTVDISMGVIPGENGAAYASIRNSDSSTFDSALVTDEALRAIAASMDDDSEPVEIIAHSELLDRCDNSACQLRTVRFTTLPYEGVTHSMQRILSAEPSNKDIVLDIDLDGFATTSPGGLSLQQTVIPDPEVLTGIFHTVHETTMCDFDASYWNRLIIQQQSNPSGTPACVDHNWSYRNSPFVPPSPSKTDPIEVSETARDLVEGLWHSHQLGDFGKEQLAKIFDYYYVNNIEAVVFDDEKFLNMMSSFLTQPYYVPTDQESIRLSMDFHFQALLGAVLQGRVPRVINLVRSPFYTPDHHLDFIECEVVDRLFRLFGDDQSKLYHTTHVDLDRTHCLDAKFPLSRRVDIGHEENPHIESDQWQTTSQTYAWFHEDDDDGLGRAYKHTPIEVTLINEHDPFTLVVTFEDGSVLEVPGGKQVQLKTKHLARWGIALQRENNKNDMEPPLLSRPPFFQFNGKNGPQQTYGSITGLIPVYDVTPVKLEITNPDTSGKTVEVWGLNDANDRLQLDPGETGTFWSYHGHLWTIHDNNDILWEVIANATYGIMHTVELFDLEDGPDL